MILPFVLKTDLEGQMTGAIRILDPFIEAVNTIQNK